MPGSYAELGFCDFWNNESHAVILGSWCYGKQGRCGLNKTNVFTHLHPQSRIQDSCTLGHSHLSNEVSNFTIFFVLVTGFQNKQHCLRRNKNLDNLYLPLPIFASSCSLVKSLGNGCALVFCSRWSECPVSRKENRMIRVLQLIWESPRFVLINAHHTNFSTIHALYSRKESERTHTKMQRE